MTRISAIGGISRTHMDRLVAAGITSVESLLHAGSAATGRRRLASMVGVDETLMLTWVNRADLMRVAGVDSEFADLLELAGVASAPDLAARDPEELRETLRQLNASMGITRRDPALNQVTRWIEDAKKLATVVEP